ncbi:MAG: PaaI family thioesterase [Alphaproteobacteria bacterium]|nr:PaaI family thioesterase [Alphaproteobacteria bacterium SS10]
MTVFEPKDPDYAARVQAEFDAQGAMAALGMTLTTLEPGRVVIGFPMSSAVTQQNGYVHGGVTTTAMDSACGFAAISLIPDHALMLTAEFKVNLLSPAAGEQFVAEGKVLKPGRQLIVTQGSLYAPGQADKPMAIMTATMMVLAHARS